MSHVIVGERLGRLNPEMVGHVIRGAGHFVQTAAGLFQTGAMHMPAIPVIAARAIPDLSTPIAVENWQWAHLNNTSATVPTKSIFPPEPPNYTKGMNFSMSFEEPNITKGIDFTIDYKPNVPVKGGNCRLAFGADMHYTGPGSEAEQLRETYRDSCNREAFDRVSNGSDNPRDIERANEYARDHSA